MRPQGFLRPHDSKVNLGQRLADALILAAAYAVALRRDGVRLEASHALVATLSLAAFHFVGEANGLYRSFRGVPLSRELARVASTFVLVSPIALFGDRVLGALELDSRALSIGALAIYFVFALFGLVVLRGLVRESLKLVRARGHNSRRVAILGSTPLGEELARKLTSEPGTGLRIVGFYDDRPVARRHSVPDAFGRVIGTSEDLVRAAKNGDVDMVYIALPMRAEDRIAAIVRRLSDTTVSVYMAPDFRGYELMQARISCVEDLPVVSLVETPFRGGDAWLKRAEDIVIGSAILALISVPMLFIALAVKATSRGPVLFKQRRYGLGGDEIRVLKFRTMSVCEDGASVKQATKNDPRVTRLGAFLRKSSMDELPQFLQVITGEMSIVGPRPHAVAHNEQYRRQIGGYMLRHKVKPGITGWAQVNGYRGETDTLEKMEKRVEHDLDYIRRWSLLLDLRIIFMTVFGRKTAQNAY